LFQHFTTTGFLSILYDVVKRQRQADEQRNMRENPMHRSAKYQTPPNAVDLL